MTKFDYLNRLEDAAKDGREIISGARQPHWTDAPRQWQNYYAAVYRDEVPDSVFCEIVPEEHEDAVIEAMVDSGKWWRSGTGFNLMRD